MASAEVGGTCLAICGTKLSVRSASDMLPPDALQVWTEVLAPTPTKREASLHKRIGISPYRLKEYKRNKKAAARH